MQATAPTLGLAPGSSRQQPDRRPAAAPHDPLHGLDVAIESAVGVDLRLLYGMIAPILVVVGLIIALVLAPSYWLVAAAWIPEVALLLLIVTKILAMLGEPDDSEPSADIR